jgi:ribosomal protein L33
MSDLDVISSYNSFSYLIDSLNYLLRHSIIKYMYNSELKQEISLACFSLSSHYYSLHRTTRFTTTKLSLVKSIMRDKTRRQNG